MCRPTPIVRFMHMSETRLKATHVSHGTQNIGTLVLLPEGTIYLGTPKHYLVVSVQENMHILAQEFKKCKLGFRLRVARLISPWLKPGALRRDLVKLAVEAFAHLACLLLSYHCPDADGMLSRTRSLSLRNVEASPQHGEAFIATRYRQSDQPARSASNGTR